MAGAPSSRCLLASTSTTRAAHVAFRPALHPRRSARLQPLVVRAQESEGDEVNFEAKLAALKTAKGKTPIGQGAKKKASVEKKASGSSKKDYDWTNETVYFETTPALGDMAINIALGATLVWLPLTFAAIGRVAFVKYRFTDKRLSVISNAPWENSQLDAAYQEVQDVKAIGRGIGLWGDMVVELRNGDKVEMRAVPRWQEMRDYVLLRAKELQRDDAGSDQLGSKRSSAKGFA